MIMEITKTFMVRHYDYFAMNLSFFDVITHMSDHEDGFEESASPEAAAEVVLPALSAALVLFTVIVGLK